MGDLTRSISFSDTDPTSRQLTAARLHELLDGATISQNAVTASKIASGAIESRHLSSSLTWSVSKLSLASGKLLGGGATNVGSEVTVGASLVLTSGTLGVATGGVTAAMLAGNITSDKLTAVGTAGTKGTASKVAQITTDVAGRVTAITEVDISGPTVETVVLTPIASAGGSTTGTFSSAPAGTSVYSILARSLADGNGGYATDDLLELSAFSASSGNPCFAASFNGTAIRVVRNISATFTIPNKATGVITSVASEDWEFVAQRIHFPS